MGNWDRCFSSEKHKQILLDWSWAVQIAKIHNWEPVHKNFALKDDKFLLKIVTTSFSLHTDEA